MTNLPKQYQYLAHLQGPKMLIEFLKVYGTKEIVGPKHNPVILAWADAVGIGKLVNDDEQAWCGLLMAYIAVRGQKHVPMSGWDLLRALQWTKFGRPVDVAMLCDVLIFKREGGGHVCMYVGEDKDFYHCAGGNQGNSTSITRIAKNRIFAIRRPIYTVQPEQVKQYFVSATGAVSTNES